MTDHDLAEGVAVRVAALCLDRKGRLSDRLLCSTAVRAALLVDLGLAGRLAETTDAVTVDSAPTGFGPADQLLASITAEPERSLDEWLEQPGPNLRDMAQDAVRAGRWELRRGLHLGARFLDRHDGRTSADRDRASDTADWTPADAAVTSIALVTGLLAGAPRGLGDYQSMEQGEVPGEDLLAAAGPVRWLCTAVTEHLTWARARDVANARALRSSDTVGPG